MGLLIGNHKERSDNNASDDIIDISCYRRYWGDWERVHTVNETNIGYCTVIEKHNKGVKTHFRLKSFINTKVLVSNLNAKGNQCTSPTKQN